MVAAKYTLLTVLLILMVAPSLQSELEIVRSKPLNGAYTFAASPVFSLESWMNGSFQDQYHRHTEDSAGFKPDWVRLHNQLDHSIFSVPNPSTVIRGKRGNYFTHEYITASLGYDHLNRGLIDQRVMKLRRLQQFLWDEKGIFLLVIVAPDKVLFYPEDIPDRFTRRKPGISGRDYLVKACAGNGINYIDFNPWFRQMKDTSRWLLFPATGVHWSVYGSVLAADSVIRYLEKHLGRPMPGLRIDRIEMAEKPRQFDDDVNETMNLVWDVDHPPLAYPVFHFVTNRITDAMQSSGIKTQNPRKQLPRQGDNPPSMANQTHSPVNQTHFPADQSQFPTDQSQFPVDKTRLPADQKQSPGSKVKALFIGDSFYWAWYDLGIIGRVFDKMEFWYYDREVYPEKFTQQKFTADVDLRESVERQDVIVLLQVGGGWGNPGAGFVDRAYAAYFSGNK